MWIATAVSCVSIISIIPMHSMFKKVAVRLVMLATVTLLGGVVLQNVAW